MNFIKQAILIVFIINITFQIKINTNVNDIEVNESLFDSPVTQIKWCNQQENDTHQQEENREVILLTINGKIYKSSDTGKNWENIWISLENEAISKSQDSERNLGKIVKITQNLNNQDNLMFIGNQQTNWITNDCGKTFNVILDMSFRSVLFHPIDSQMVLGHTSDYHLYYSNDQFKSERKLIAKHVTKYTWGIHTKQNIENIPLERIIWTQNTEPPKQGSPNVVSKKIHLFAIDKIGDTGRVNLNQGQSFILSEKYLFVPQLIDEQSKSHKIWISNPNLQVFEFREAEFDEQNPEKNKFVILDHDWDQLVLGFQPHQIGQNINIGSIHISDITGVQFNTSLQNVASENQFGFDFIKIFGIEGIYIVNVYEEKLVNQYKELGKYFETEEEDQEKHEFIDESLNEQFKEFNFDNYKMFTLKSQIEKQIQESKQTLITFDKGGKWQRLKSPVKDQNGKQIQCNNDGQNDCFLNLNGLSGVQNNLSSIYSSDNSIGLIIGTGNIGQHLTKKALDTHTFLSRDAGLSWEQIFDFPTTYEVGDHGAIIIFAETQKSTQYIYYTLDEGLSLNKVKISEEPIQISNLLIEPSNVSHQFLVFVQKEVEVIDDQEQIVENKEEYILFQLNFTEVHKKECVFPNNPENPLSDYELWQPHGYKGQCILGSEKLYIRKKQTACCYNHQQYDVKIEQSPCKCTEDDWECDIGYQKNEESNKCELIPQFIFSDKHFEVPANCTDKYYISQGYRKISNDICEGGVQYEYQELSCPWFSQSILTNGIYLVIILLMTSSITVVIILYMSMKERNKNRYKNKYGEEITNKGIFDREIEDYEETIQEGQNNSIIHEEIQNGNINTEFQKKYDQKNRLFDEDDENIQQDIKNQGDDIDKIDSNKGPSEQGLKNFYNSDDLI